MSPWRLKFTQYNRPVVGDTCIVAGNNPKIVFEIALLDSVVYLTNDPNGLPCARDRYQ